MLLLLYRDRMREMRIMLVMLQQLNKEESYYCQKIVKTDKVLIHVITRFSIILMMCPLLFKALYNDKTNQTEGCLYINTIDRHFRIIIHLAHHTLLFMLSCVVGENCPCADRLLTTHKKGGTQIHPEHAALSCYCISLQCSTMNAIPSKFWDSHTPTPTHRHRHKKI